MYQSHAQGLLNVARPFFSAIHIHNATNTINQGLRIWLSKHKNVTEADLMKLWKGLFYCFWMSDKQPIQQELAERMSELVATLPPEVPLLPPTPPDLPPLMIYVHLITT
jgi:hypothetical protein